jgi:hypothetical protein
MIRKRLSRAAVLAVAAILIGLTCFDSIRSADQPASATFELRPGDHICIIGNTLAERMQHDGWLETMLHSRFPKHDLVTRNLGFAGDEVAGFTDAPDRNRRLRSQDYGTADQWLAGSAPVPQPAKLVTRKGVRNNRFETTNTRADVIFAFFGYNESFAGEAGLAKFNGGSTNTSVRKSTTAQAPRASFCSRRLHMKTCMTTTCRTAPRITADLSFTPRRWRKWPGRITLRSSTCTTPRSHSTRPCRDR